MVVSFLCVCVVVFGGFFLEGFFFFGIYIIVVD